MGLAHEQWELEPGHDEVITEMLDREHAIRTRFPERVNHVDLEAAPVLRLHTRGDRASNRRKSRRIHAYQFRGCLALLADDWPWCALASPGPISKRMLELRAALKRFALLSHFTEPVYPSRNDQVDRLPTERPISKSAVKVNGFG